MKSERLIERSFPIVKLNPLAVRERNAFKPVYKMHKWFARRSGSIFRAVLLGAALPAEEEGAPVDLMDEFYREHHADARLRRVDGSPLRVLDPFMGGGTTVVEASRLGFDVTGVDLNPIAWFIVRGETTAVDLSALDSACARLAARVRDELLALYKTQCPLTGKDADIIYAFWVKQGICIDPTCGRVTDLFKSYEVARKRGGASLRYVPDVTCPHCRAVFDWEIDRCTVTAGGPQVLGEKAAGNGRPSNCGFSYARLQDGIRCPQCQKSVLGDEGAKKKVKTKNVPVHVLVDPTTGDFFEVRGSIPVDVVAPLSGHAFRPDGGPVDGGKFTCRSCGRTQEIVESARKQGKPLPFRNFGFYAFTPHVADDPLRAESMGLPTNNGKWFGVSRSADLARIDEAADELAKVADQLPLPVQEIQDGYNTNRLVIHQYKRWRDLYSPRQLLALGKLLRSIAEEPDPVLRDLLLAGFKISLGCMSNLALFNVALCKVERVNSAHDYRNPTTTAEANVWGLEHGRGSFSSSFEQTRTGADWKQSNWEWKQDETGDVVPCHFEHLYRPPQPTLLNSSSTSLDQISDRSVDLIITDPPYAGSVQYAEMSDWYYVWLHQVLKIHYPDQFGSELTLKAHEIIEDGASKNAAFFFAELTNAWRECHRVLTDDGILAFTFHHSEGDRWTGLLRSLFEAGFYLVAAYPTHGEALNSIVIQATKGITYDIVHVCRKRVGEPEPIAWSRLRRDVTRTAREQLREIEQGKDVLPGPDVQMILLGKALMLFSKHYGKVLDADGAAMSLDEAMERILVLVREVRGEELPLPGSLQDLDSLTLIVLLHVVGKGPWARDDLHKELRGYTHGHAALVEAGLIREVKGQRARLEAVPALERGANVNATRREAPMIDRLHALLSTVSEGRSIEKLMKEWRGKWTIVVDALTWLAKIDASVKELANLTIRQIGTLGPDLGPQAITEQLDMFVAK